MCEREREREREFSQNFRQNTNNNYYYFKQPVSMAINVATNIEVGKGNLGTKKGVIIKCTKPILFSILMDDYQISYSWDLKTILFANGLPKHKFPIKILVLETNRFQVWNKYTSILKQTTNDTMGLQGRRLGLCHVKPNMILVNQ